MLFSLIFIGCFGLITAVYVAMRGAIRASNDEIAKLKEALGHSERKQNALRTMLKQAEAENLALIKKYRNCQPRCPKTGRLIKTK
jgi:septal ring factor EnvC (AmiA/AmiB activator)